MKLVSYLHNGRLRAGAVVNDKIYRLSALFSGAADDMCAVLALGKERLCAISAIAAALPGERLYIKPESGGNELIAPVPGPGICIGGYAFRQNRGVPMIAEYDQYPVLYYMNPRSIRGPGNIQVFADHLQQLDFELQVAAVIGNAGKNIRAEEADRHIAGLMILNDFSARTLQMEEMVMNLGPAKGKDFATATGPYLVTPDELTAYECACKPGHTGKCWNLDMRCRVNGILQSAGNLADMDWTFAELIERASYGTELRPGDIIASGTVGTGCLLELNGTGKRYDREYQAQWLQPGDNIEMSVTGLGTLKNTITAAGDWSILNRKKNNSKTYT